MIPIGGIIAVLPVFNDLDSPIALTDIASNASYRLCDGSVVNDTDSPLHGFKLPDLRQRQLQATNTDCQHLDIQIMPRVAVFNEDCFESQGECAKILAVEAGASLTQNPMIFARYYMRVK